MKSRLAPAFICLFVALACDPSPTPMPGSSPPDAMAVVGGDAGAVDAAVECMPSKHPGTLTMVNEVTGVTKVRTLTAEEEPQWWRSTPQGRVPVVKSVYRKPPGEAAEIFLFGPCDQLLEVLLGAP